MDNLINGAKEEFGGEAESALEQEASQFVGADTANAVVGGLGSALGIEQPAAAGNATATAEASTDDTTASNN